MAAMRNKLRLFFPGSTSNIVLAQLRDRLLRIMLYCSFAVGTVLFGLALIPVLQKGMYPTIFIYSLLFAWTILITFDHRLPYRVRAIGWLVMLFAFGLINLLESGFNVDSGLFLITFIAMSILLMDVPAGLVALLLSSALISSLGFINTDGQVKLPVGLPQSDPLLWIIGGIIFVVMGVLLIYSLTVVVHGLEENLSKANLLADELKKTNETLRMSETRYRTLVETSPDLVSTLMGIWSHPTRAGWHFSVMSARTKQLVRKLWILFPWKIGRARWKLFKERWLPAGLIILNAWQ